MYEMSPVAERFGSSLEQPTNMKEPLYTLNDKTTKNDTENIIV